MRLTITERSNLSDLFFERVAASPRAPAYRQFRDGAWVDTAWEQVAQAVGRWQEALRRHGLKRGDRVAICSRNRLEWVLFDQAALGLGLVTVPLFYNDRPDNMAWCLNDAGARLLLLEDGAIWPALSPLLSSVERAVCLNSPAVSDAKLVGIEQWLPREDHAPARASSPPDELATIVYTSGTTGRPKGVMLTHRNIVADLRALMEAVPEICDRPFRFLSFLPLSHMFERTVGYYIPMVISGDTQVVFARGIPELPEDLVSQKPSIIVSVPRIFERVYTKIEEGLPVGSPKRKLFDLTVEIGWRRFKNEATLKDQLLWPVLNILVASKLRARLGGEIQYIFLGGAALAPHLLKVFTGVGLTFIHGYGLTETSPVLAANRLADNDPMSVGHPLPGVETRIAGNGELLIRGAIIMKGYWNNPTATSAAIDADGWFHSGDVVEVREGRIYIRGRVKDVIILSNGEKIPPGDAEQAITQDAAFEQVMVIGEGRAHLGLIAVSKVADEKQLCERANRQLHAFPGYAKIRHIMRVSEPWTVENGLLTPTLKLKRNKIEEKYAKEIEAMYKRNDQCSG
ncbi:MAG: long-chain fatty acid--CoA ligase [Gammaproteobacteria bacterium]|nr:long-chain fatty acid--CoA ligase [Gammaproteobacteria bacterium]